MDISDISDISKIADRLLHVIHSDSGVPVTSNPAESLLFDVMGPKSTLTAYDFETYLVLLNEKSDGTFKLPSTEKTGHISDAKDLLKTIQEAAKRSIASSRNSIFKRPTSFMVNNQKFLFPVDKENAIKIKALASTQLDKLNRSDSTDQFEKTNNKTPKCRDSTDQSEIKPPRKKTFSLECTPKSSGCETKVLRDASGSDAGIKLLSLFKTGARRRALAFAKFVPADRIKAAPFNGSMIPQPELEVLDHVPIRDALMNTLNRNGYALNAEYQEIVINTTTGAIMYRTETGPRLSRYVALGISPKKNKRILAEMLLSTSDKGLANSILEHVAERYPTKVLRFIANSGFTLRIEPKATQLYTPDDALIEQIGPVNAALLCDRVKTNECHRYSSVFYRSIGISASGDPELADYVQAAIAALNEVSLFYCSESSDTCYLSTLGGLVSDRDSVEASYFLMGRYRPSNQHTDVTTFTMSIRTFNMGIVRFREYSEPTLLALYADYVKRYSAMTGEQHLAYFDMGTKVIEKSVKNKWLKSTLLQHRSVMASRLADDNAIYCEMAEKYQKQADAATNRVNEDLATQISKIKWR